MNNNLITIEDLLEGAMGNMSDDQIDSDIALYTAISKVFGKKKLDTSIIVLVDDNEYDPDWYAEDKQSKRRFDIYSVNGITVVGEHLNGRTYIYFATEEDAEKYINYVDHYYDDDSKTESLLKEYVKLANDNSHDIHQIRNNPEYMMQFEDWCRDNNKQEESISTYKPKTVREALENIEREEFHKTGNQYDLVAMYEALPMSQQEKQSIKDFLNKNPNASAEDVKKVIDGTVVASKTLPQNEKRKILNTSFEIEDDNTTLIEDTEIDESIGNSAKADFGIDIIEYEDESGEYYKIIDTVYLTLDDVKNRYSENTVDQVAKGVYSNHFDKADSLIHLINQTAYDRWREEYRNQNHFYPDSEFGFGTTDAKLLNNNLFDTSEKAMQKKLGRLLLSKKELEEVNECNEDNNMKFKKKINETSSSKNESCSTKKKSEKKITESTEAPYFKAYITNLGKYNEGDLVGKWVEFPIDEDDFNEELKSIGIGSTDEFGSTYEEWFVADYDSNISGISDNLGEYPSYEKLQETAELIDKVDDVEAFEAGLEIESDPEYVIEKLSDGDWVYYSFDDFGYSEVDFVANLIDELYGGVSELRQDVLEYFFDYEKLGRDLGFDSYESEDEEGNIIDVSAGEYFCGDENATDQEIGEAFVDEVGFDGISDMSNYFDYDAYARDMEVSGELTRCHNGWMVTFG